MDGETQEVHNNLPTLEVSADNFLEIFNNQDEQVQTLSHKSKILETQIDGLRAVIQSLESQKSEIDADLTKLRLRNITYQKEHTYLRNAITVVKFQIQKIKESIIKAKAADLKNLEDFEKTIDEITKRFRSGPNVYDRKVLLEQIQKERENKIFLTGKLNEVRTLHEIFCKTKGLRVRKDENEELLNCILPDSELSCLIEMTKTLDSVIFGMKKLMGV